MRILLVEDDVVDARVVRALLQRRAPAAVIDVAPTLQEASDRLADAPYDVALVDLSLPDGSGLDAVVRVRDEAPSLPVVVLTGNDNDEAALEAVRLGADDYLLKGGSDGDLLWRSLRYAIERSRRMRVVSSSQEELVDDLRRHLELLEAEQQLLRRLVAPLDGTARTRRLAGRYALQRLLGRGANGEAWLAKDELLARRVCVKLYRAQTDVDAARRFAREARLAAGLEHPNIVRVYDFGHEGGQPFLVMEYAAEGSVGDALAVRGSLEPSEAARLMAGTLAGLDHVHRHGLLHRDLKPANVLLADATPKLADFGLAVVQGPPEPGATQEGLMPPVMAGGTPAYMSPEAAVGARLDARSDIYCAGAMLFHLLAGRPYLDLAGLDAVAARRAILEGDPARVHVPGAEKLMEVALAALEKDPQARPASAAEMRARLLDAAPERLPPEARCARSDRRRSHHGRRFHRVHAPPSTRALSTPSARCHVESAEGRGTTRGTKAGFCIMGSSFRHAHARASS